MQPKCKPGDIAVVVEAYNKCNIGTFVHVIGLYSNQSVLTKPAGDVIWLVEAKRPMTYDVSGVLSRKRKGPVPDSQIRPIRGELLALEVKQICELITE